MEWKTLLLQSGAIFIAVFFGMKFFSPTPSAFDPTLRESFQASIHALEVRLDNIVTMLSKQRQPGPSPSDLAAASLNTDEIHRTLRAILATLSRWETKENLGPSPQSSPGGRPSASEVAPLKPPPMVNPVDWIQWLSEDKRAQVNEIFREQASILREKMTAASAEGLPPLDKLHTIMEENNQEVKNKLQPILNAEEYRSFLDSLPKPPPLPKP